MEKFLSEISIKRYYSNKCIHMNNTKYKLYGAILGDLAGQPYEYKYRGNFSEFNIHDERSHITDDTVMTLATAAYMLGKYKTYEAAYKDLGLKYDDVGYGQGFRIWLRSSTGTLATSWANGCMMRLSPLMYSKSLSIKDIVASCLNSHVHENSIDACIRLSKLYSSAHDQRGIISSVLGKFKELPKFTEFDVTAAGTIEFIENAYFLSDSTHDLIHRVILCEGDTDTNASIIRALLHYTYNDLPKEAVEYVESKLPDDLLNILHEFNAKFI